MSCQHLPSAAGPHAADGPSAIAGCAPGLRAWRILHLCQRLRAIASILDLQFAAGMQPLASTPAGLAAPERWLMEPPGETQTVSLITAWREVRNWRRLLAEHAPESDVVHAHCFPAGMAAVRSGAPLVYDVPRFVEEEAVEAGQISPQSWLARSFRTAEQFVLSRAGAVIVHSAAGYRGALARGTPSANLFLIFSACPGADAELEPLRVRNLAEKYDAIYSHVLWPKKTGRGPLLPPGWQPLAACL